MRLRYLLWSFVALCLVAVPSTAQTRKDTLKLNKPVPKVYKFSDNLFWGMSGGASYSMSEYVRSVNFFTMLRPNFDIEFGKHLNKWLASRVMFGYHSQWASTHEALQEYFPDAKSYSFSMVSGYVDVMACLDRLFTPYNPEERHQFWAFGGVGGMVCFGYSDNIKEWTQFFPVNTNTKIRPALRLGLQYKWNLSSSTSLYVQGLWATVPSSYDGKELKSGNLRHFAELSVGFNVSLGNRYGQHHFEDCGHNANRYFEVMNSRLGKMHQKAAKAKAKAYKKAHKVAIEPEQNITESDSILLFPIDYTYLTYIQKNKLKKMAKRLEENPSERAVIHIYPDERSTGLMELAFRVKNRGEQVVLYLTEVLKLQPERYRIIYHSEELPPYHKQHIFTLGGIIRYEQD